MPTQTPPNDLAAAAAASPNDKAKRQMLLQAKADAKALFDCLRAAAVPGTDADVRAALVASAKQRMALVDAALKQIGGA